MAKSKLNSQGQALHGFKTYAGKKTVGKHKGRQIRRIQQYQPQNLDGLIAKNYLHNSPYIFQEFLKRKGELKAQSLDSKILTEQIKQSQKYFYHLLDAIGVGSANEKDFLEIMRQSNEIEDNVALVNQKLNDLVEQLSSKEGSQDDLAKIQNIIIAAIVDAINTSDEKSAINNFFTKSGIMSFNKNSVNPALGISFDLTGNYKQKRNNINRIKKKFIESIKEKMDNDLKGNMSEEVFEAMFYGTSRSLPLFQIAGYYYQKQMGNAAQKLNLNDLEGLKQLKQELGISWEDYGNRLKQITKSDEKGALSAMMGNFSEELCVNNLIEEKLASIRDFAIDKGKGNFNIDLYIDKNQLRSGQSRVTRGNRSVTVKADVLIPITSGEKLGLSIKSFHPKFKSSFQDIKIDETTDATNMIDTLVRNGVDKKQAELFGYMLTNYGAFIKGLKPIDRKGKGTMSLKGYQSSLPSIKKELDKFLRLHAMVLMGSEAIPAAFGGNAPSNEEYLMTNSLIHDPSNGVTIPIYQVLEQIKLAMENKKEKNKNNIDFSMSINAGMSFNEASSLHLHTLKLKGVDKKNDTYRRNNIFSYPDALVAQGSKAGFEVLRKMQIKSNLKFKTEFLKSLMYNPIK